MPPSSVNRDFDLPIDQARNESSALLRSLISWLSSLRFDCKGTTVERACSLKSAFSSAGLKGTNPLSSPPAMRARRAARRLRADNHARAAYPVVAPRSVPKANSIIIVSLLIRKKPRLKFYQSFTSAHRKLCRQRRLKWVEPSNFNCSIGMVNDAGRRKSKADHEEVMSRHEPGTMLFIPMTSAPSRLAIM